MSKNPDRGPGQPPYKATRERRRQVAIAAGAGMSHEEIALALGIARNTLEKHFVYELSVGAYRKRLQVLDAMHAAAVKGNVAAGRAYLSSSPRLAAPPLPPDPPAAKTKPLGKKEQAQVDAGAAARGTDWDELLPTGNTPLQ